ncbi:MAG: APC family permease, partial [Sulfobacillus thermotolerans]|nr:APC family permease [Sulfobacillus thermotolerans]
FAVMLSTIATLETTLIQVTRSLFAMGRDHTLPRVFAAVHPRWRTPWIASIVVGILSLVLFVASNFIGSVSTIMTDAINAIGLQIAIYYGLAGLAVVVAYREWLFKSFSNLLFIGLWPLLGALFMFWILFQSLESLGATTVLIGMGSMVLGLIPLGIYWAQGQPYFRQAPLQPATDDVPNDQVAVAD